jgi:TctA family transporter
VIKVFDFSGKEISTLVDCDQNSGKHEFSFDASWLPAGIYFVLVNFKNQMMVKKIMKL